MEKKSLPLVSVIMSSYNEEKYIGEAIESILNQTYENLELIIIDDASTDNTANIIQNYKDERIIYWRNETNRKLAHNLNYAISISKGTYIARMDADDIACLDRIEKQVNFLEKNLEIDVLGTYAQSFGQETKKMIYPQKHDEIKAELLFKNAICHPTVMFRRKSIDFKYNEKCAAGQDYELWSRIIWNKNFYNLPESLLNYRMHVGQTKKKNPIEQKSGGFLARKIMLEKLFEPLSEEIIKKHYLLIDTAFYDFKPKTNDEMKDILIYADQLIDRNTRDQIFNIEYFNKLVSDSVFWQWYSSLNKTDITVSIMANSKHMSYIKNELNYYMKMKIMLKCLQRLIRGNKK